MLDWIQDCYIEKDIDYEAREEALAEKEDIEYQDRVYEEITRGDL